MIFICYYNSIEEGEYLEISDDFVGGKGPYFRGKASSVDGKDGDIFLQSTQVKLILLIWIFELFYGLTMGKFFEFYLGKVLVVKVHLVSSN